MDFSLTTLYVVPVGNTLPTTGSTENLAPGQFGIFRNDYSIANSGNVAGIPYIYADQGRSTVLYAGSKRSDKIAANKVKSWYKVSGNAEQNNQILEFSNFSAKCGENITFSFRMHGSYQDTISFNGIMRSVTVNTECCDCGGSPCTDASAEAIVDAFLQKIAQENAAETDYAALKLSSFLVFEKIGTGANTVLRVIGKPPVVYTNPYDIAAFPYEYDRLWFRGWVYKGAETLVDFLVYDICNPVATATITQRSSFPTGTSAEIKQLEKDYFSYQSFQKHLFREVGWDQTFETWVTDGTVYDTYYIQFDEFDANRSFTNDLQIDERVIIAIPQGSTATIQGILVAYLGAVTDNSASFTTTTTTTSTTSTSTTNTTTLTP